MGRPETIAARRSSKKCAARVVLRLHLYVWAFMSSSEPKSLGGAAGYPCVGLWRKGNGCAAFEKGSWRRTSVGIRHRVGTWWPTLPRYRAVGWSGRSGCIPAGAALLRGAMGALELRTREDVAGNGERGWRSDRRGA